MTHRNLLLTFDTGLSWYEIPLFRGAVLSSMNDADTLFHNHHGDMLRYGYPLIQYKMVDGRAALFCLDAGVEAVGQYLVGASYRLMMGRRVVNVRIDRVESWLPTYQLTDAVCSYRLRSWLPFNETNYETYLAVHSVVERTMFLERILTGNILSMLKGVGVHLDEHLHVSITHISEPYTRHYKQVALMAFDVSFECNLELPPYVGVGRHVSVGFGTLAPQKG